jgi:hypothetical protein
MPGDGLFGFGGYACLDGVMGDAGFFRFDSQSSKKDPVAFGGFGAADGIFCCKPPLN